MTQPAEQTVLPTEIRGTRSDFLHLWEAHWQLDMEGGKILDIFLLNVLPYVNYFLSSLCRASPPRALLGDLTQPEVASALLWG